MPHSPSPAMMRSLQNRPSSLRLVPRPHSSTSSPALLPSASASLTPTTTTTRTLSSSAGSSTAVLLLDDGMDEHDKTDDLYVDEDKKGTRRRREPNKTTKERTRGKVQSLRMSSERRPSTTASGRLRRSSIASSKQIFLESDEIVDEVGEHDSRETMAATKGKKLRKSRSPEPTQCQLTRAKKRTAKGDGEEGRGLKRKISTSTHSTHSGKADRDALDLDDGGGENSSGEENNARKPDKKTKMEQLEDELLKDLQEIEPVNKRQKKRLNSTAKQGEGTREGLPLMESEEEEEEKESKGGRRKSTRRTARTSVREKMQRQQARRQRCGATEAEEQDEAPSDAGEENEDGNVDGKSGGDDDDEEEEDDLADFIVDEEIHDGKAEAKLQCARPL